jgi:hypothetical protein
MLGYQHVKFEPSSATLSQNMNAGAKIAQAAFRIKLVFIVFFGGNTEYHLMKE